MFAVTCAPCHQRYLVGARSLRAFRNNPDGPVAVVRCPAGHLLEHEFRTRAPRSAPTSTNPVACTTSPVLSRPC